VTSVRSLRPTAVIAVVACVLGVAALGAPLAAAAESGGGSPSAQELWRRYPLHPKGAPSTTPPSSTSSSTSTSVNASMPPSSGDPRPGAPAGAAGRDGDGSGFGLLALLALVAGGGAGALVLLRGRRAQGLLGPEPEPATEPVAALRRPALRRRAGAASLFATPPEVSPLPEPVAEDPRPGESNWVGQPPDVDRRWSAEIEWRHDGERCRFCALTVTDDDAEPKLVAISRWLRGRRRTRRAFARSATP
jgi:hypothetical protein